MNRRRFLTVIGASAALAAVPLGRARAAALHRWRGAALGAEATILLHHDDAEAAGRLLARCAAEIERLEGIFSLYRRDSALCRLNARGRLDDPPLDLVRLLSEARRFAQATGGAFDPTVQPLFQLHAEHFGRAGADPAGPPAAAVAAARSLVGHADLLFGPEGVALARPGMGVTLNGIAQGYVTDRVAEMLAREGIESALLDLGETRALGPRPDGTPWSVGLADPLRDGGLAATLPLARGAVATSAGSGTRFDAAGRFHHLFDPRTGGCAGNWLSVTVRAPDATTADALSTGFSALDEAAVRRIAAGMPGVSVRLAGRSGVIEA